MCCCGNDLCQPKGTKLTENMADDDTQLDDINRNFTFEPNTFDLVHSRLVGGGINRTRWPSYLRDIKR